MNPESMQQNRLDLTTPQVCESILHGRQSAFDNLSMQVRLSSGSRQLDTAFAEVDRVFVKLPRLALCVRGAIEDPNDASISLKATALAEEIYNSEDTCFVRGTLAKFITPTPTSSPEVKASSLNFSFHFESFDAFNLATRYFLHRVLLCGLIQTLCDLRHCNLQIDRSAAETEDILAAMSIAQCVDWALNQHLSNPLAELKMLNTLQLGFGAWHRLQKKQPSTETGDYQYGLSMKAWFVHIANHIDRIWQSRLTSYQRLEFITEMFAGGPLMEWMNNYRPGF